MIMTYVIVAMTTFLLCSRQKYDLIVIGDFPDDHRCHINFQLIFNSVH